MAAQLELLGDTIQEHNSLWELPGSALQNLPWPHCAAGLCLSILGTPAESAAAVGLKDWSLDWGPDGVPQHHRSQQLPSTALSQHLSYSPYRVHAL